MKDAQGRTALYRLYGAGGTLLYIGVTGNLLNRLREHRREKSWWPQVAGMRLAYYDRYAEAREAERAAVRSEDPAHNICLTPRHGKTVIEARKLQARHRQPGGLLSGDPLLFGGEPEWVRARYRELIKRQLREAS